MSQVNMNHGPASLHVVGAALRDWYDDWVNLFVINVLVLLAWVTVVLGPPATFGMYYVTNQLARGDSQGPRELIQAARQYFGKSWLWMGINIVVAVLVFVNYVFYQQITAVWSIVPQTAFLILGVLWLVMQFYTIPYLMEQETKSLKMALRNSLFTVLGAMLYTIVVVGLAGLIAVSSIALVLPLALASPCLLACMGNRAVMDRLETYGVRERELARLDQSERTEETD